jgi:hypothetical protein
MSQIIHAAPAGFIPLLAISAFAGIRSAEIAGLDWSAVDSGNQLKNRTRQRILVFEWLEEGLRRGGLQRSPAGGGPSSRGLRCDAVEGPDLLLCRASPCGSIPRRAAGPGSSTGSKAAIVFPRWIPLPSFMDRRLTLPSACRTEITNRKPPGPLLIRAAEFLWNQRWLTDYIMPPMPPPWS